MQVKMLHRRHLEAFFLQSDLLQRLRQSLQGIQEQKQSLHLLFQQIPVQVDGRRNTIVFQ